MTRPVETPAERMARPYKGVDCPAIRVRRHDRGYPFGERVPSLVRSLRHVVPDWPCALGRRANGMPVFGAHTGDVLRAWTNSYGAVSARMPDGSLLGLYPHEFEVVEWWTPPRHPRVAISTGGATIVRGRG